ncbi:hypothetical protein JCM21900_003571 [Sporobolomyces salmonicolor]
MSTTATVCAPSPVLSQSPALPPSSPRQQLSKIPRRRPSTQLDLAFPSLQNPPSPRSASNPLSSQSHGQSHARHPSKTHFADPPATDISPPPPASTSVEDRRPRAYSHIGSPLSVETEERALRRTPLSIYIPPPHRSVSRQHNSSPTKSSPHATTVSPSFSSQPHSRRSSGRTPRTPHAKPRPPVSERNRSRAPSQSSAMIDTPTTYQSFDLPMPRTPGDEIAEHEARSGFWFGRYSGTRTRSEDEEEIVGVRTTKQAGERTALLRAQIEDHRPTQTKLKYVWGEVICYAKHMLPLVFVFVFVVLTIALLAYKRAIDRIVHPPSFLEP